MKYDNIEIGTSDFRTLIEFANGNGLSVEPIPVYYDNLADRKGWVKVNKAISNVACEVTAYYVDPSKITDEPEWVRGCNAIGKPHPTIATNFPHLTSEIQVECIRMKQLFTEYDVTEVGLLKIDTEGHDIVILNDYLDSKLPLADNIIFESNQLMDEIKYRELLKRLAPYYKIKRVRNDTYCRRL